jgi:formylglycine-generating enzyme required for sulfatase activity
MAATDTLFFYCPAHQVRVLGNGESTILCEQGGHEIGSGFPGRSWWKYCCDCATFWPSEVANGNSSSNCPVCERLTLKRFLCSACQVISIESASSVPQKTHSIEVERGIRPSCPACKAVAATSVVEHQCADIGFKYLTSRSACLFCEDATAPAKTDATPSSDPASCSSCGAELTSPFKFCKRCGSAQTQAQLTTDKFEIADDNDETDDGSAISSETDAPAVPSYSFTWQQSAELTPPKRRAPWKFAVLALGFAVGILLIVIVLSSKPKETRPAPEVVNRSPMPPDGMVYVASGEFFMGTDQGDEYERPAHKVLVKPFFMDITEVTCEKYLAFVKATGHRAPPQWTNNSYPNGAGDLPVTGVDWYDASAYAQWSRKRLPTEQEWEYAARGNDGRKYPWGNEWIRGAANAGDSGPQHLVSVGAHPDGKTSAGLMDMIGNAWEWTSSDPVAYPKGKLTKPPKGDQKVIRGGSWQELSSEATTTYRGYLRKSGADDYSATGFRCAADVSADNTAAKQ